jgi:hypothetical protein
VEEEPPELDPAAVLAGVAGVEEPFEEAESFELLLSDEVDAFEESDPFEEAPADSVALPLLRESLR